MELIFATQNQNKIKEVKKLLPSNFNLLSLTDLNYFEELTETHDTLEENAFEKAVFIYKKFNKNCFAEDTGLEIDALNGEPGIYSARYSQIQNSKIGNMDLVLEKLKKRTNRNARFKTIISLIFQDERFDFMGSIKGHITYEKRGENGFGYDSIFQPIGYQQTFGEMNINEKSKISHRKIAMEKLGNFFSS